MDLLEFVSNLGIVACIYLIVFTSEQLTNDAPYDDHTMYILAFAALHVIFAVKYVLQEAIDDEPAWVAEDAAQVQNRVDQVRQDTADKKLWERMSDHYSELDLLFEVLGKQHEDLTKAA